MQALLGAVFSAGDASIFVSLLCGLFGGLGFIQSRGVVFDFLSYNSHRHVFLVFSLNVQGAGW